MIQKIGAFCKGKITFIEHEKRGFERIVMENGTLITQDGADVGVLGLGAQTGWVLVIF